jgi:hypothetical protein
MYYPLSQIITNLYTNGNEYIIASTKSPYSGYYWKNSKGQYFTGKTPQDTPTEELITSISTINNTTNDINNNSTTVYYNQTDNESASYLNLIKQPIPPVLPYYSLTLPTQQDYQIGEMRRYFCKKANEISYLEINNETYNKLVSQDSSILYQYYIPFNIPWQLTGNKEKVFITNKNIVGLTIKQQKLSQFDKYLKEDYTKYYK